VHARAERHVAQVDGVGTAAAQEPGEVLAQKLEARRRQVAQPTASPDFDGASARRERDPVPESPAKPTAHELARHQQARLTIACDLHEERC
jgi:hypothetical protein